MTTADDDPVWLFLWHRIYEIESDSTTRPYAKTMSAMLGRHYPKEAVRVATLDKDDNVTVTALLNDQGQPVVAMDEAELMCAGHPGQQWIGWPCREVLDLTLAFSWHKDFRPQWRGSRTDQLS